MEVFRHVVPGALKSPPSATGTPHRRQTGSERNGRNTQANIVDSDTLLKTSTTCLDVYARRVDINFGVLLTLWSRRVSSFL